MKSSETLQAFKKILKSKEAFVGFKPLKDEADYRKAEFLKRIVKKQLLLPGDRKSNPAKWAAHSIELYDGNRPVCVFVPGQRFDIYGTRHGRGGGWYDRFLARIPKSWTRVGIVDTSRLYLYPITRQSWDEPVDWLLVQSGKNWRVYKTGARS